MMNINVLYSLHSKHILSFPVLLCVQPNGVHGAGGGRAQRPVVEVAGLGGGPALGPRSLCSVKEGLSKSRSVGGVRVQVL